MEVKSFANVNKEFVNSLQKPSKKRPKSRQNGRGASFPWKSGRGDVFSLSLLSTLTYSPFFKRKIKKQSRN